MKTFGRFVNEIHSKNRLSDFEFAIDIRDATKEELDNAIKEFEKYECIMYNSEVMKWTEEARFACWAWHIELRNRYNELFIYFNGISTPNWGKGIKYMEDIITLKEFLNVGLAGVKEYIEIKNSMNKYNL